MLDSISRLEPRAGDLGGTVWVDHGPIGTTGATTGATRRCTSRIKRSSVRLECWTRRDLSTSIFDPPETPDRLNPLPEADYIHVVASNTDCLPLG